MFLKTFDVLEGIVKEIVCTNCFAIDFEIRETGRVNVEIWYFQITFENILLLVKHGIFL